MFKLPDLPYAYDALQPTVSTETMKLHHDKHHAKYIETTNKLLEGKDAGDSLEEVIVKAGQNGEKKLFNNAAQAWNHAFFWVSMAPTAQAPSGELADAIDKSFGGFGALRSQFVEQGLGHFGSGWVWLAAAGGEVRLLTTHDGEDLLAREGQVPLLVCDLWEHAYYVDYRNDREAFLKAWFDHLPNWALAGQQWAAAQGQGAAWRFG